MSRTIEAIRRAITYHDETFQRHHDAIRSLGKDEPLTYEERNDLRTYLADVRVLWDLIEGHVEAYESQKKRTLFWRR